MKATKLLAVFVTGLTFLAITVLPALADSLTIKFEPPTYIIGSIDGQDGWKKSGAFDVAVVPNIYGYPRFGKQSLRMSDAVTSGSFGDQTFAKPLINAVGERDATAGTFTVGTKQKHFEMKFDIASTQLAVQPGMHVSVSPDRGDGSRMSYLRFEDALAGIDVFFDDVQQRTRCSFAGCANFVETQVAAGLNRAVPHKIKLTMDTVNGPSNDIVKVYIDGALVITGTSWEDYYRFDPEAAAEPSPRIVKTVLFRESGTANPAHLGQGFLVDNFASMSGARDNDQNDQNDQDGQHGQGGQDDQHGQDNTKSGDH